MVRGIRTPEEIQTRVSDRIQMIQEVKDKGLVIRVPLPTRTEPDHEGCNWAMWTFGNASGCEDAIAREVALARGEVNLASE